MGIACSMFYGVQFTCSSEFINLLITRRFQLVLTTGNTNRTTPNVNLYLKTIREKPHTKNLHHIILGNLHKTGYLCGRIPHNGVSIIVH